MTDLTNSVRSIYQISSTTLGYYFATSGESLGDFSNPGGAFTGRGVGWTIQEKNAFRQIFDDIETFTNLQFIERSSHNSAQLTLVAEERGGEGALASLPASLPFYGWFDVDNFNWDIGLEKGGLSYVYMLHELGHVMGLEHTHEDEYGGEILQGVNSAFDTGLYGLNQGVFTVMGYNDGWDQADFPIGSYEFEEFGREGTYSPIDIALLQEYYGANTSTNSGSTNYQLDGTNDPGTHFATIWDVSGIDAIRYSGSDDATIDLRAATLDYSPTGGGAVSYVDGVKGGYTIANGVVIERGYGGSGDDKITGNINDNLLSGGDGADILMGLSGANSLQGGTGSNYLVGGFQDDTLTGGTGRDIILADHLASVIFGEDRLIGGRGNDVLSGGAGRDTFVFATSDGSDRIAAFDFGSVRLSGNTYVASGFSADFEIGIDVIELVGFSGLNSGNIQTALSQTGNGAQFNASGTTILFEDISLSDLTNDHFTFV